MNTLTGIWMHATLGLLWGVAAIGIAWYCGRSAIRITYVTLADGRRQERRLPFLFRLLLPLAPNLKPFFTRPSFEAKRNDIDRQLVASGYDGLLVPAEVLALRALFPIVLGPIYILLLRVGLSGLPGRLGQTLLDRELIFYAAVLLILFIHPTLWLKKMVLVRQRSIERALPFVLDLMTLSVEAGLDFMTAVQRIIERRKMDPLGEELVRVFREVQLGKTRREALKNMSMRVGQSDLRSVTNALVQADELGVSIGDILRTQADQMRSRRFLRAEKLANEAPVKLLFPLVTFIFPSVFIVLLGPVMLQLLSHGL